MSSNQPLPSEGLTPEIRDLLRPPKSFAEPERERLVEAMRRADPIVQARDQARAQLEALRTPRGVYDMFSTSRYLEDPFKAIREAHKEAADQFARSVQGLVNPPLSLPVWEDPLKAYREAEKRMADRL